MFRLYVLILRARKGFMWVNRYNPAVEKKLSGDIRIIRTLTSSLFVPIYYDNWESIYEKSNCRIGYELRLISWNHKHFMEENVMNLIIKNCFTVVCQMHKFHWIEKQLCLIEFKKLANVCGHKVIVLFSFANFTDDVDIIYKQICK